MFCMEMFDHTLDPFLIIVSNFFRSCSERGFLKLYKYKVNENKLDNSFEAKSPSLITKPFHFITFYLQNISLQESSSTVRRALKKQVSRPSYPLEGTTSGSYNCIHRDGDHSVL